jgi:hypothetical protein
VHAARVGVPAANMEAEAGLALDPTFTIHRARARAESETNADMPPAGLCEPMGPFESSVATHLSADASNNEERLP